MLFDVIPLGVSVVEFTPFYEMITGKKFKPGKYPLEEGIRKALKK